LVLPDSKGHVWHLFVIRTKRRDSLQAYLYDKGCGTLVHYPRPVYRLPPFAAYAPSGVTISDRLTGEVLSLPMGHYLREAEVDKVCNLIQSFFS
jgi:dTDP-4-amino-4,6-dideoxygalactose transaminase